MALCSKIYFVYSAALTVLTRKIITLVYTEHCYNRSYLHSQEIRICSQKSSIPRQENPLVLRQQNEKDRYCVKDIDRSTS